jgi:hypothetical protein
LKAVLLHNGNTFLSIPLTHAIHKRECTWTFRFRCKKICNEEHRWIL